jgi:hypothetical protein
MAAGFRGNMESAMFEACTSSLCTTCGDSAKRCTMCKDIPDITLFAGSCIKMTKPASQGIPDYEVSSSIIAYYLDFDITKDDSMIQYLNIEVLDTDKQEAYILSTDNFQFTSTGFRVNVGLETSIDNAVIYISQRTTTARRLRAQNSFMDILPILTPPFVLANSAEQRIAAEEAKKSTQSLAAFRFAANILYAGINLEASIMMDRLLADYAYLALIGNQKLYRSRLVLEPIRKAKFAPFPMLGEDFIKPTRCFKEAVFIENNIACSFIENYLNDFIFLLATLFGTFLVTVLGLILRNKKLIDDKLPRPVRRGFNMKTLKYIANKVACIFTLRFGLAFFMAKTAANAVKILIFVLFNIYKMNDSWQMGVGMFLSIIILVYFGYYSFLTWKFARQLSKEVTLPAQQNNGQYSFNGDTIKRILRLNSLHTKIIAQQFSELRADIGPWAIYWPLVALLRDFLIAFFIVIPSKSPVASTVLVLAVELVFLVLTSLSRHRANIVENILEIIINMVRTFYVLLACLTFLSTRVPFDLDESMKALLVLLACGVLMFVVYIMLITIYEVVVHSIESMTVLRRSENFNSKRLSTHTNRPLQEITYMVRENPDRVRSVLRSLQEEIGFLSVVDSPNFERSNIRTLA